MKKFLASFALLLFLSSCSEYQNALKSEDVAVKFVSATKMYEANKYSKAIRLFEQIISIKKAFFFTFFSLSNFFNFASSTILKNIQS